MHPHHASRAQFTYPEDKLMPLRGFVDHGELCKPTMLDANEEACLIVVKNGAATGVTFGRASGIESFTRDYDDLGGIKSTSREIAIYSYSKEDGAFSCCGDSGSVIADANHRIVGMLTGGAGLTNSTDVTYASSYAFLQERIRQAFPHCHLFPSRP